MLNRFNRKSQKTKNITQGKILLGTQTFFKAKFMQNKILNTNIIWKIID